ncbi:MAG: ATP-binding protein [Verrucomicrobiae bacterium]|nr:ATP-binding protein [Verrucomicrobiae bacterium]
MRWFSSHEPSADHEAGPQTLPQFPHGDAPFDNPIFVVGRNGSGKSNLAGAFGFVSEAMSSPLQAFFDRRGGIASVRNRSSVRSAPPNLGIAFEFGPINGIEGGRYAFEEKALPNDGYRIVHEQCLVRNARGCRITDADLRIVSWQGGASHLLPLSKTSREAMRQHLMGAGELLRSNALHADDLFIGHGDLRDGDLVEALE